MKKYKYVIIMILLTISAMLAGVAFAFLAIEHAWLMILFNFYLTCAFIIKREV